MSVLHIALREAKAVFTSGIGWLVAFGFLVLTGVFWTAMVQSYVLQGEDLVFDPYGAQQLNLTDWLLSPFFGNVAVVLMFVTPALSMRLYSEEIKQRTLELLLTSPLSSAEIVLGKFLGALIVLAALLLGTASGPLVLFGLASPDVGVVASGYLGLLVLGAALLALGSFTSSLTSNQIVALVWAFGASLVLFILSWMQRDPTDAWAQISLLNHLESLFKGEIKLSDLAYFAGFTSFFLFATHQRMESFRWT